MELLFTDSIKIAICVKGKDASRWHLLGYFMDKRIIELNDNWKFHYGECEEAWYKGYDDSTDDWKSVFLPHDWSVTMPFSPEYSSGTGYLAGGRGWYRCRFKLPAECAGKRIFIHFDGVYKNSMVWCNSYYLGKRPSGYVSFSYDITDQAVFGDEENEVSVKVIHDDIADSRWFTGSGITRKVYVTIQEQVYPKEYGVFFNTESIAEDGSSAQIAVHHTFYNKTGKAQTIYLESKLIDHEGKEVLTLKSYKNAEDNPDKTSKDWVRGSLKNPHLWSVEDPYLYRMESRYKIDDDTGKAKKYLVDVSMVGIRTVTFDPDKGLFLNGESIKLKGVCVHHDGGCLGAAMKKEVWQRRLEALRAAGCNAIRCSHNPHMPELYDLCDHMGFLMMDEAFDEWENPKNKWSIGHNVYPPKHQGYYEDFPMWHEEDLISMIRRDRNHPSVILYSIGNEVDYPNDPYCHPMFDTMTGNNDANKPENERRYDKNKPNMERLSVLSKKLTAIVKKKDPTRPVTVAAAFPELSTHIGFIDGLDVVGYNYKEEFYEQDHERFPAKTFLGSENGHSYKAYRAYKDRDYICGQFLWTGIDYLGEAHGWPVHGSTSGILTTAGIPKPEYLRRKTFWSDEPTVSILTRRVSDGTSDWLPMSNSWDYEEGEDILVRVYVTDSLLTDDSSLAIYLNGELVDEFDKRNEDNAFEFVMSFKAGTLWAELDENVSGELRTPGAFHHLEIEKWDEPDAITGENFEEASAKTGYLYQFKVMAVDENKVPLRSAVPGEEFFIPRDKDTSEFINFETGNPKFMDNFPEIAVTVEGAGELVGIDSGNVSDTTPLSANRRKLWNGEAVVYVRRTGEGEIAVTINGEKIFA